MTAFPVVVASLPMGPKAELRLSLDSFNGKPRLDIRTWADYAAGPVNGRGPTKKGVGVPLRDLAAFADAVREAGAMAKALGLLDEGGATG